MLTRSGHSDNREHRTWSTNFRNGNTFAERANYGDTAVEEVSLRRYQFCDIGSRNGPRLRRMVAIILMNPWDREFLTSALEEVNALLKRLDVVATNAAKLRDELQRIYMQALLSATRLSGVMQRAGTVLPIPPLINFAGDPTTIELEVSKFLVTLRTALEERLLSN